jgi:nicotinate-nucleotide pyrophosphorylase (carboxylating)
MKEVSPMIPELLLDGWLRAALREDLGSGDVTSEILVPADLRGRAVVRAKEPLVVAGLDIALRAFVLLSAEVGCLARARDGERVDSGAVLLQLEGPVRALLGAERVALNILQHLSGVATLTRRYVDAVEGTGARILDTRKTLPGMRILEKYAVRAGGGFNHRASLSEGILVKENHLAACGGVAKAVEEIRRNAPHTLRVEVEAATLAEVEEAVRAGVDGILLDNMSVETIRKAVRAVRGAARLEVSGGVCLQNVREIAETGVEAISVGRLTHSAPAADISLLLQPVAP